jgi:phage tail-like protein
MFMDEIKFKCINTQKLWESNNEDIENLTTEGGELRLSSTYIYESGNDLINNASLNMSDIAVDGCNKIFIIDKNSKSILTYEIDSGIINDMGELPIILESPSGIAVDKDSIYVTDKGRLIAFARSNLQIRWILSNGYDGSPINELIDITIVGDVIYALEKCKENYRENDEESSMEKRILIINRAGKIYIPPISLGKDSDPTDITVDTDGDIYVLDRNILNNKNSVKIFRKKFLFKWRDVPGIDKDKLLGFLRDHLNIDWLMGAEISRIDEKTIIVFIPEKYVKIYLEESKDRALITISDGGVHYLQVYEEDCNLNVYYIEDLPETIEIGFLPKGLAVDSNKQIYIGETAGDISNDQTIYKIIDQRHISPMWSYRGASERLVTDSKSNLYVIDNTGKKLIYLKYNKINRSDKNGLFSGHYISKPINSQDKKTRWHRFLLEGKFEEGTQVDFSYYISDNINKVNIEHLEETEWHQGLPGSSSIQGTQRRDALFQEDIQGQYLWFRISLTGTETLSPVISSIQVFFPRFSYLDHLPAIYQEDAVSKEFFERFLSIFESIFYEIDFKVERLSWFFDALGAPPEFISWLGSWLAISDEENFSDKTKRLYIQRAIQLYKKRGTREGLEESIALFLYSRKHPEKNLDEIITNFHEEKPVIVENFSAKRIPQQKQCEPCQVDLKGLYFLPHDAKTTIKKRYEFNLREIQGSESDSFKQYLKKTFSVNWIDSARIEITDENNINIKIYNNIGTTEKNIFLKDAEMNGSRLIIYEDEIVALSDILFGKDPFGFCVLLSDPDLSESTYDTIKRIIEEQKPAHTCYGLKMLEPWFSLDMHTYLEVNTRLTYPSLIMSKTSVLGRDTVLYDTEHAGQVRVHSRTGIDTKLT